MSVTHQAAGVASPTADLLVRSTWAGLRRTNGVTQAAKIALLTDDIRSMVDALPDSPVGRGEACLILFGFASALRRSELVALDIDDATEAYDGVVVTVNRSKTDQEGEGRQIGILYGSHRRYVEYERCAHGSTHQRLNTDHSSVRSTVTDDSEPNDSPTVR